ncbi:MAG: hypothetical protein AVDCRST_MAG21-521 [uncultured Nocardioidaceae bacterium]|uniref:Uncharacterized protein n=1 Tax=uncultured Nocardioidaceae bacterium TaxID=253824 RepID=A0A6J4MUK9_9ACTN|nr:MAG: hypothetical protein AVDCRST_MAG21-521 [uncultured Nocardioidaceae bacterium]
MTRITTGVGASTPPIHATQSVERLYADRLQQGAPLFPPAKARKMNRASDRGWLLARGQVEVRFEVRRAGSAAMAPSGRKPTRGFP